MLPWCGGAQVTPPRTPAKFALSDGCRTTDTRRYTELPCRDAPPSLSIWPGPTRRPPARSSSRYRWALLPSASLQCSAVQCNHTTPHHITHTACRGCVKFQHTTLALIHPPTCSRPITINPQRLRYAAGKQEAVAKLYLPAAATEPVNVTIEGLRPTSQRTRQHFHAMHGQHVGLTVRTQSTTIIASLTLQVATLTSDKLLY